MAETMASQQAPADVSVAGLTRFKEGDPTVFPPAAEVLRFAKERLAVGRPGRASPRQVRLPDGDVWKRRQGKGQNSSPAKAAHCAANRGSASQDDGAITAVVGRLDVLAGTKQHPQEGPQAQAQEQIRPKPGGAVALLQQPLASVLPATQAAPSNLAHLLGPPPTVRQQPAAAPIQPRGGWGCRPKRLAPCRQILLTGAVLAQSQALVSLVSQFSAGARALYILEGQAGQSAWVRGSVGRAKLQQELARLNSMCS